MSSRLWQFRLQDILEAISRIQSYTQGLTLVRFQMDGKTVDAVERNFILIGEAAGHVPDEVTQRYHSIPWRKMRDMRNVVVHAYWGGLGSDSSGPPALDSPATAGVGAGKGRLAYVTDLPACVGTGCTREETERRIAQVDQVIAEAVYSLYGLTVAEGRLVEEAS